MQNDPTAYILGASLLSACIGFFGCAIMCSRRIREAWNDGWKSGVRCARDHEPRI